METPCHWNEFFIRPATIHDLDTVLRQRWKMFEEMGADNRAGLEKMTELARTFFWPRLANGMYQAWLVENTEGAVIAGCGIILLDYQPNPFAPSPTHPMIINMYTDPLFRRRGIARKLMEIQIDWCRDNGYRAITLHASDDGRPLYEALGFKPTNEMRLWV
jgi:GNAT superfamily N-acetyltransferase